MNANVVLRGSIREFREREKREGKKGQIFRLQGSLRASAGPPSPPSCPRRGRDNGARLGRIVGLLEIDKLKETNPLPVPSASLDKPDHLPGFFFFSCLSPLVV